MAFNKKNLVSTIINYYKLIETFNNWQNWKKFMSFVKYIYWMRIKEQKRAKIFWTENNNNISETNIDFNEY